MVILCLAFASKVEGQIVRGTVKDATTGEVLPFANVFINNTTIGTTTNDRGQFVLALPGYGSLIISFVGYGTETISISPGMRTVELDIALKPEKKELEAVKIESTRDKSWEKKFRAFEKEFLGKTQNAKKTKILNPWVIDFIDNPDHFLMAESSEPIQIENKGLGYNISFQLIQFNVNDKLFYSLGRTRFSEMEPADEKQRQTWIKNRLEAYNGAETHLYRAMIEGKVHQEGFELYVEKKEQKKIERGNSFYIELRDRLIPFSFAIVGGKQELYKVTLPGRIEVHYTKDTNHPYYRDNLARVFWIEPLKPVIEMTSRGILRDPTSIMVHGYVLQLRVADMLPFDYEPKAQPPAN